MSRPTLGRHRRLSERLHGQAVFPLLLFLVLNDLLRRQRPMSNRSKPPVEFTDLAKETVLRFMEMQGNDDLLVRVRVASASPLDPATKSR